MKIRKSILAAATAATVSVSGVVAAPAFAADEPAKDENVTTEDNNNDAEGKDGESEGDNEDEGKGNEDKSFGAKLKANSSDDNGDWDPKAITAWISVFTAVLGLVGSVLTFAQKNFKLPF
ncbi:hypothetical protein [uncultured Corynebacterium sp.]|uniref:hypothetical protein n=1 Tax=uncultured Corynebacterium sp. TaxID=159447 RepID=UPI0025FEADC4|nr:hypothetical protein [uncultured Corynebacterium sp.]